MYTNEQDDVAVQCALCSTLRGIRCLMDIVLHAKISIQCATIYKIAEYYFRTGIRKARIVGLLSLMVQFHQACHIRAVITFQPRNTIS